jgi:VCBS repeat-containing protein
MPINAGTLSTSGGVITASTAAGAQSFTATAALKGAGGGYVQVWVQDGNAADGSGFAIVARLFDNAGNPLGPEFTVNASGVVGGVGSDSSQLWPSVVGLADGGFVVVWQSSHADFATATPNDFGYDIYGQRYSASGALLNLDGSAAAAPTISANSMFKVNTFEPGGQGAVSIEARTDGGFTVVWTGSTDLTSTPQNDNIYARIYAGTTATPSAEIAVNTAADHQITPDIATIGNASLIVWQSLNGANWDVFGQRIDAAGALVGGPVRINSTTANDQFGPSVTAIDKDGNGTLDGYMVVWTSANQDIVNSTGVYGRIYDANFVAISPEFLLNDSGSATDPLANNQALASVVSLGDGTVVVTWDSAGGVFARRFDITGVTAATPPVATTGAVLISAAAGNGFTPYNGLDSQPYGGSTAYAGHDSLIQLSNKNLLSVFYRNSPNDIFAQIINAGLAGAPNNPPNAVDDSYTVAEESGSTILTVLSNDDNNAGVAGEALTIRSVTQPVGGTVTINGNNTLTFTPNPDFTGITTFTYELFDGNNANPGVDTATVTVNVTNDNNDPPVLTATGRNPTFFPTANTVDLFSNVAAVVEGSPSPDDVDEIVLTVTNVTQGATERLIIDGTTVQLVNGNVTTTGNIGVTVSLSGTTATVTLVPPPGFTAAQLVSLVDGLQYQNITPLFGTPGTAQRVVTITSVSDDGGPDDTATLSLSSTVSPSGLAQIVSVSTAGVQTNANSALANQLNLPAGDIVGAISADGRYVAFQSTADNLVSGDTNNGDDIFLRDRYAGTTIRASLATDGSQANGHSYGASVSDDGLRVAFISQASNLIASDTNGRADIFVRNLSGTPSTVLVNVGIGGASDNGGAGQAEISGNGRYVAFTSTGNNLVAGDTNNLQDIFVRDLNSTTITRLSVATDGAQATGGDSSAPSISTDGRYVVFTSAATNLVAGGAGGSVGGADGNGVTDIFLRDTQSPFSTIRISLTHDEQQANGASTAASVSDDGKVIAFVSTATNLVAGTDPNGTSADIYVRTLTDVAGNGTTIRITGTGIGGGSSNPVVSNDGSRVSFENNGKSWVYEISSGRLTEIAPTTDGLPASRINPIISGDGQTVTFQSGFNNIVSPDTNALAVQDIFAAPVNFNRPPTINPNGVHHGNEGGSVSFASAPIIVGDPDGNNVTVTLTVPQGTLTATVGGNPVSGQSIEISGAVATVNTALATLTYQPPNTDFSGTVTLTVVATDSALVSGSATQNVQIDIAEINDNPTLSGLASSVTYEQAAVNPPAPAPLIDGDVTFADIEGNFAGGHLVVRGLLPEDRVSINAEGFGSGQVSFDGSNVFYSGTQIGSATGGNGKTFVVTFNSSATSEAVDAVIQNLTYANVATTVTQDRTLHLDVIDAAGGAIGFSGPEVLNIVSGGPGSMDAAAVTANSAPAVGDVDGDGDIDLLVGSADGTLHAFVNNGSGSFLLTPLASAPFNVDFGDNSAPAFGDLDGDGKLDLVVGAADGKLRVFKNGGGGVFTELTAGEYSFMGVDVGTNAKPVLADVNGDSNIDLVVGDGSADLHYWVNVGGTFLQQSTFDSVPVGGLSPGNGTDAAPAFVDIDGDGDLDLFAGNSYGAIYGFRNEGGVFSTQLSGAANPFSGLSASTSFNHFRTVTFADIDGDGDLDALVGDNSGGIQVFANTTPDRGQAIDVHINPANRPPDLDLDGDDNHSDPGSTGFSASYTEGNNSGVLITDDDVVITDPDAGDTIKSATVTISNFVTDDQLVLGSQTGFTVTGSGTGTIIIDGTGTAAQYAAMLEQIRFLNTGDNPTSGGGNMSRNITFVVTDAGGADSTAATATVAVTGTNDAPVAVNTIPNRTYTEDRSLTPFGGPPAFSDPDGDALSYQVTDTNGNLMSTIGFNGTRFTGSGPANFNGALQVKVVASDGSLTATSNTVTLTFNSVNDAPTIVGGNTATAAVVAEDLPGAGETVLSLFESHFSDARDAQFDATTNPSGSQANTFAGVAISGNLSSSSTGEWQYFNGSDWVDIGSVSDSDTLLLNAATKIRFKPALDYHGVQPTLTVHLIESGGPAFADGDRFNIDEDPDTGLPASGGATRISGGLVNLGGLVTAVNDQIGTAAPSTASLAEDSSLVAVTGLSISDVDATLAPNGVYEVTLSATHGTLTMTTLDDLTFTGGDGTADASMTFHGTLAAINTALATLKYTVEPNYNGTAEISFQATDTFNNIVATGSGSATSSSKTVTVTVTPVNDPVTANAPATAAVDEDSSVSISGLSIADVDAVLAPDGVYQVTLSATHGTVSMSTMTGLSVTSGGNGTATITFNGTLAAINNALATASYAPDHDYEGSAELTLAVTDQSGANPVATGSGAATSNSKSVTITVNGVNDEPTLTATGASATFTEGGAAVDLFNDVVASTVETGQTFASLTLKITNVTDGSNEILSIGGVDVPLDNGNVPAAGGTASVSVSSGTATVTLTGLTMDAAQLQALLDGLTYRNTSLNPTDADRVVTITALVDSGSGTASNDNSAALAIAATVNVNPVNTPADITGTASGGVTEAGLAGSGTPTATGNLDSTDVDGTNDAWQTASAGTPSAGGYGTYEVTADGVWTYTLSNDAEAVQKLNGGDSVNDTFTVLTADGTSRVVTIAITGANDGASIALSASEDTAVVEAGGTANGTNDNPAAGGKLTATDVDDGEAAFQVPASTTGTYGDFTFNAATGEWSYALRNGDANVQALNGGEVVHDTLTVKSIDETATHVIDVTITGANDIPTITVAAAEDREVTEDGGVANGAAGDPTAGGKLTITDPDDGESSFQMPGAAALTGTYGTFTFSTDGTWGYTLANGQANVQELDGGQAAQDKLTVTSADGTTYDIVVDITGANDAPSGTDGMVMVSEDDPYTFSVNDFGFSDPADHNDLAFVIVDSLPPPAKGTLTLNGNPVLVGQSIAAGDIAAGNLVFTPAADAFGTPYTDFTFRVQDNGPTGGVNQNTSQAANKITINVTPDNVAPVVDLDGGSASADYAATYTEDGAGIAIGSSLSVSDANENIGDKIESLTVTLTNAAAGDVLSLAGALPSGISSTITSGGGQIVVAFTGSASGADYTAALAQVRYSSTSQDPAGGGTTPSRTITVVASDGMVQSATAKATITVLSVEDPAVARNDGFVTDELTAVTGNVFANNGSGADGDVDGPPLQVSAVNGSAAAVGQTITLLSGATLRLNADGSFSYDPSGNLGYLTEAGSGAVNISTTDGFTYTLTGGGTATVTVGVHGIVTLDDQLWGDIRNNVITGTARGDFFLLNDGGNDTAFGNGGNDGFVFGAAFTADDKVDGGAGDNDQVSIQGDYSAGLILGAQSLVNVETLLVLPDFDYKLTAVDANVPAGGRLQVFGTTLRGGDDLTFDGSAEKDGFFVFYGGAGKDTLTGGDGNDGFYFGPGNFSQTDTIHGGPGGNDQLGLDGHYSMTLGGNFDGIETLVLYRGPNNDLNSFNLAANDAAVAAGQRFTILGSTVVNDIVFDGSAESDGSFRFLGGQGNDSFTGGKVDDLFFGARGGDTMNGGGGNDVFVYNNVVESTAASFDKILGFGAGDRIDLSGIDANGGTAENEAFAFIGAEAFSGAAGELRAVQSNGGWTIEGDTNGDKVADLMISVSSDNGHIIAAGDFVF